jgi:hypothetical protein
MRTDMVTREEMRRCFEQQDCDECGRKDFDVNDVCKTYLAVVALLTAPTFEVDCSDCYGSGIIFDNSTPPTPIQKPCPRCVDGQITVVEVTSGEVVDGGKPEVDAEVEKS